jgi:hypothetical protein
MSDSVKFIFKTLIKVPCLIFVAYFILNIFAFCYTYFKMLGFSYVVMQTAVENNYLPTTEYNQLNAYIADSETSFCKDVKILINNTGETHYDSSVQPATSRRQYGKTVIVGVSYKFRMVWPLMATQADSSTGQSTAGANSWNSNAANVNNENKGFNTVEILYKVPGLKYYPDLSIS